MPRLAINYMGLPYTSIQVDSPDIEKTAIAAGTPPLEHREDGSPHYTLPAFVDDANPSAPVRLADSKAIAEYLDATYPNADPEKSLFPKGSRVLQALAYKQIADNITDHMVPVFMEAYFEKQTEGTKAKYAPVFAARMADKEQMKKAKEEGWEKIKKGLEELGGHIQKYGGGGDYLLEKNISFVDLHIGAALICVHLILGEEEIRKQLKDINNGLWVRLLDVVLKYL